MKRKGWVEQLLCLATDMQEFSAMQDALGQMLEEDYGELSEDELELVTAAGGTTVRKRESEGKQHEN